MMNYRAEIEHDRLLICLLKELDSQNRLDIVQNAFQTANLGRLQRAQRRKLFDVELTFYNNLSLIVETKVDSDEDGRWGSQWQTERIVNEAPLQGYLRGNNLIFLFITYGTSEFYTKLYRTGAASSKFKHITLSHMIDLADTAIRFVPHPEKYREWLRLMRVEQEKRDSAVRLLSSFSGFRAQYLRIHGENDFPNNRLLFCAPELAFPVLHLLSQEWNRSKYVKKFGKVALYPVGRPSPSVHDSILSFWEMWDSGTPSLGTNLIRGGGGHNPFYFEINEDFNLNLKTEENLDQNAKNQVWSQMQAANWPNFVNGCCRDYRQGVSSVLYEIDFGLLAGLNDIPQVVNNLAAVLNIAVQAFP